MSHNNGMHSNLFLKPLKTIIINIIYEMHKIHQYLMLISRVDLILNIMKRVGSTFGQGKPGAILCEREREKTGVGELRGEAIV